MSTNGKSDTDGEFSRNADKTTKPPAKPKINPCLEINHFVLKDEGEKFLFIGSRAKPYREWYELRKTAVEFIRPVRLYVEEEFTGDKIFLAEIPKVRSRLVHDGIAYLLPESYGDVKKRLEDLGVEIQALNPQAAEALEDAPGREKLVEPVPAVSTFRVAACG